jgi:exodeoxyribonuclease V gamma subunit
VSLVIHHGPHLGPLGDALAQLLTEPLADPFATEVVAVPTAGVRDWLQRHLALRLGATGHSDGVVANVDMMFPGRFVAAALGLRTDEPDPWEVERLTWAVLTVLARADLDVPGSNLPAAVTARRIADLFDRYATNRPEIIQQWCAGHDGDGTVDLNGAIVPVPEEQRWQPRLWREVRDVIGEPSRAERLPGLLAELRHGRCAPSLPARVAVFGVSTVAPGQLQVIEALAAVRDVHLHVAHPSPRAWQSARTAGGRLTARAEMDASATVAHPLLRSWARPSMEAATLLRGSGGRLVEHVHPTLGGREPTGQLQLDLDDRTGFSALEPVEPTTALEALQLDVLRDAAPTPARGIDASLQFHACHGVTRQLEVLRDVLAHLFVADPTLQPSDVLVLCPNLDRFAALASAVFARGTLPVPLRVTDLTLGSQNVVATALTAALALVAGRATAADVLAFCGLDPVRTRFGITLDDLELYDRWVAELGTTWGLDAAHRADWLSVDVPDGTWAATLDRVLVGAAMPAPLPRAAVGDVVPFDDMDAGGFEAAGRLADLLARLRRARADTRVPRPIADWCEQLGRMIDALFLTRAQDAWQLAEVSKAIDDLRDRSMVDGGSSDVHLTLADVRAMVASTVAAPTGRLNLRSGAVTMTAMVPVRNLPARVVCIAGLDEGELRAGGVDGDDLLGTRPCLGEREPRAEGRLLLLDAVMAAQDHLVVTFDGSDVTTNRRLPLPVHVSELLAAADGGAAVTAVVRHPRRSHDPLNFVPAGVAPGTGAFSFDSCRREGARAAASDATREALADRWAPLPVSVPPTVTVLELTESCARPSRTYLRDRLDVRLPREREAIDNHIPITVRPLERYALGDDLLRHHRVSGFAPSSTAADDWRTMRRLQGSLPPRALATAVLDDVGEEVGKILDCRHDLRAMLDSANRVVDVDLALTVPSWAGAGRTVALCDRIESISGSMLLRVAFVRPKARGRLAAAVALAALVATHSDEFWQVLLATRNESSSGRTPFVKALLPAVPHDAAAATRFLETVLDLRLRALREPIPLFEFSREIARSGTLDDDVVERQMNDDADEFLWAGMTAEDLLGIPPAAHDPRTDVPARGSARPSRLVSMATHLWGAYDEFVSEQKASAS